MSMSKRRRSVGKFIGSREHCQLPPPAANKDTRQPQPPEGMHQGTSLQQHMHVISRALPPHSSKYQTCTCRAESNFLLLAFHPVIFLLAPFLCRLGKQATNLRLRATLSQEPSPVKQRECLREPGPRWRQGNNVHPTVWNRISNFCS